MKFFKRKQETAPGTMDSAQRNSWEGVGDGVQFAGEKVDNREVLEAKRQQDKVIAGLRYGARAGFAQHEAAVNAADREWVMNGLAGGEIGLLQERDLLSAIRDPMNAKGAQAVFDDGVAGRKHPMRILAAMTGVGFGGYEKVGPAQIGEFLDKYPLPMDFEEKSADFLMAIKEQNSPQKYQEYAQAMDFFKKTMYGKRQEYWEQMKDLNARAAEMARSRAAAMGMANEEAKEHTELTDGDDGGGRSQKPAWLRVVEERATGGGSGEGVSKEERAALEAERQQNKVIVGLVYGAKWGFGQGDTVASEYDKDRVLERMASGEIGDSQYRELLSKIQSPADVMSADELFGETVAGRRPPMRILATMTGVGFDKFQDVSAKQVGDFLGKYPLPMDFEKDSEDFLRAIREHNPAQKYQEYASEMELFKKAMYGKRQEYWEQIKALREQAAQKYATPAP